MTVSAERDAKEVLADVMEDWPDPDAHLTWGQRLADRVAAVVGSWPFIVIQSVLLLAWMVANVLLAWHVSDPARSRAWDPYPFILLNLVLSFQAAYTGPVVMMSQNRQAEKDRLTAQRDYAVDTKAEAEIRVMLEHLAEQDKLLLDAMRQIHEVGDLGQRRVMERIEEIFKRMEEADHRTLLVLRALERMHPLEEIPDHDAFPPHQHE
jgi:uncharacterized membrane protein